MFLRIQFDDVQYSDIKQQDTHALLQLQATLIGKSPIKDKFAVLWIVISTPLSHLDI